MRGIRIVALLAAFTLACVFATPAHADDELREQIAEIVKEEMGKKNGLRAYWKTGLRLDSADKNFKLKLGGRVMVDFSVYDDEDFNELGIDSDDNSEDGVEFRRVRLYNSGLIYGNVEYKLQMDFADANDPQFKDVYLGLVNLEDCLGCLFPSIRIGHFKQPVSLGELTSSKYITFMERSSLAQAFAPSRKTGIMLHDSLRGDQLTWAASYFGPTTSGDSPDFDFDDGTGFAARVTWTPWYDCECDCNRLHLGASYASYSDLKGKRFRARPPTHRTTRFVNTGTISDVEEYTTIGFEAALVYGPWSVQAEYMIANVDSVSADDPTFNAWYVYASYWLTGECRPYKKGTFSRVKPCCNFLDNDCCCTGGWELKARYEYLDLTDGAFDGGEQTSLTVGVNWHLNPNTRFMFEYFTTTVDGTPAGFDPDGSGGVAAGTTTFNEDDISGFQVRFQVDF